MKITCCDICGSVVNSEDTKYVLGYRQCKEKEDKLIQLNSDNLINILDQYNKSVDKINTFEVCEKCMSIVLRVMTLRKEDMMNLRADFDKIWPIIKKGATDGEKN